MKLSNIIKEIDYRNQMGYTDYEWRKLHKGWQYKGDAPRDVQWQKDRQNLFKENGNGWWWLTACKETHTREN